MQDIRIALRQLRRSPVFFLFAALTLSLGIGANLAIFSVVSAVLLKPLPFQDASRIVAVCSAAPLPWSSLQAALQEGAPRSDAELRRWTGLAGLSSGVSQATVLLEKKP